CKRERRDVRRPNALRSVPALRSNGCMVGAIMAGVSRNRAGVAVRSWRTMPSASSLSLTSNPTERWMSLLWRCASGGFRVAAARLGGFLDRHDITFKKSLRAAEQTRPGGAGARRRWIRQQGHLDTMRLVFIDETTCGTSPFETFEGRFL